MQLLDGKKTSDEIKKELAAKVAQRKLEGKKMIMIIAPKKKK